MLTIFPAQISALTRGPQDKDHVLGSWNLLLKNKDLVSSKIEIDLLGWVRLTTDCETFAQSPSGTLLPFLSVVLHSRPHAIG